MVKGRSVVAACAAMMVLGAASCGNRSDAPTAPDASMGANEQGGAAIVYEAGTLEWAVYGPWRTEAERARDRWRNPISTLKAFDVQPDHVVVEISPGGGWYSAILGPYLKSGGGVLYAAHFDPERSERAAEAVAAYQSRFVDQSEVYGEVRLSVFGPASGDIAPEGSVDRVLTFRNVHNWMAGGYADRAFADFFRALKPGGLLGVVEHRLPPGAVSDPLASTGYVSEDEVIAMARLVGFELVNRSEVNANLADTADHPFGVWTLPPTLRTSAFGEPANPDFDTQPYRDIGESDRMTLVFRKPENATVQAEQN